MKRIAACICACTLLSAMTSFPAAAKEAVPVDVDEAVYAQLLTSYGCDADGDGVVTEEEFRSINNIRIDPTGIEDMSWMTRMDALNSLTLEGGTLTDAAAASLAEVSQLRTLLLLGVTLEDISFIGEMNLSSCYMQQMDYITDQQRLAVMRVAEPVVIDQGFAAQGGVYPIGLLDSQYTSLVIEDTDIACFDSFAEDSCTTTATAIYGKQAGTTGFTLYYKEEPVFSGTIQVQAYTPESPQLHEPALDAPQVVAAVYHGNGNGTALLKDGTLYSLCEGGLQVEAMHVKSFCSDYVYDETNALQSCDVVVYEDGSVTANGQAVETDLKFVYTEDAACITAEGDLYQLRRENGVYLLDYVYSGFGSFMENVGMCFLSDTGEVILKELLYLENGGISRQAFATGIRGVISAQGNYFVDADHVLWEVKRSVGNAPTIRQLAKDVEFVGYRYYSDGTVYGCVHITSDGTAYRVGTAQKVILSEHRTMAEHYRKAGNVPAEANQNTGATGTSSAGKHYHLGLDNTLTLQYGDRKTAVSDVAEIVDFDYSANGGKLYLYFIRTDGSLWCYSAAEDAYQEVEFGLPELLLGDVNADGAVTVADVVKLQNYLMGRTTLNPDYADNAELCPDGEINGIDLALLKKMLVEE